MVRENPDGYRYVNYANYDWYTAFRVELPDRPWIERAACVGLDTNLFYPTEEDRGVAKQALKACRACPVRVQCLQYALDSEDIYGIHGGVTQGRRRRWVKKGLSAEEMIRRMDSK
jgi:hypothetical protein